MGPSSKLKYFFSMQNYRPKQRASLEHFILQAISVPSDASQSTAQSQLGVRQQNQNSSQTEEGLFIISVAARMLAMHPQTLRKYERVGLVHPSRTIGMLRLYSQTDIAKLRMIKHLVENVGLNLAGVELVIALVERLLVLRASLERSPTIQRRSIREELDKILYMLQFR